MENKILIFGPEFHLPKLLKLNFFVKIKPKSRDSQLSTISKIKPKWRENLAHSIYWKVLDQNIIFLVEMDLYSPPWSIWELTAHNELLFVILTRVISSMTSSEGTFTDSTKYGDCLLSVRRKALRNGREQNQLAGIGPRWWSWSQNNGWFSSTN